MAHLKVITNSAYRNYSTQQRERQHLYEVREDEGCYSDNTENLLKKMKSLLDMPQWPEYSDGIYLKPEEAAKLYRLAHGAQGLAHILNRSAHHRGLATDYRDAPTMELSEFLESQIWAALIEISRDISSLIPDPQMCNEKTA